MSAEISITSGVPKGSILGPLLLLVFINELPISLHNVIKNTAMYADDNTIWDIQMSKDTLKTNLQSCLTILETWCKSNGMVLNTDKTKVLMITTPHKRARPTGISLSLKFIEVQIRCKK